MMKLTKKFVESIKPHTSKTLKYWDTELKGFGVIILPSGRCTYSIKYRNLNRIQKMLKIGVHGQITTEQARALAKKYLGLISEGKDPAQEKQSLSEAPSFSTLIEHYKEKNLPQKRVKSQEEDKIMLKKYIAPVFYQQKVHLITHFDIQNLHIKLKNTPYRANRVISLLSKMFSLALAWGWVDKNPVIGIQKYQEEKRTRWLDDDELRRLWIVLNKYPQYTSVAVFKFLLLTGARKGEALNATWEQFDLKSGTWTKPSHLTKQRKEEHLPLSLPAIELLKEQQEKASRDNRYVFPGKIPGHPLKEIKTFWKRVTKEAGLDGVRIHDLRHTHASHLVSSGLSLSIVGKLLGHTQASTTQRYAHLSDDALRNATAVLGDKINIIDGKR